MTYHVFIGYDDREHEAYLVAKHSLLKHATVPVQVHKLHHKDLREKGLFEREWLVDKTGQYIDQVDGKPFSTQFSHSRFLVPELWKSLDDQEKSPLVMFVDCDFVWTQDIAEMFDEMEKDLRRDPTRIPAFCVKHDYNPTSTVKMDNIVQVAYNMKLWTAMMVFNMDSPDTANLTVDYVNKATGREMHTFEWVTSKDSIGSIDEKWHYVPNHSEEHTQNIAAVHFTELGPWFPHGTDCALSEFWWKAYGDLLAEYLFTLTEDTKGDLIHG